MATEFARVSGSYSTAFIGRYDLLSQSVSGNYSTFRLYGVFYYGGGTSVGSSSSTFTLNGTNVKTGSYRYYPGETQLGTVDITVYHNNDGSFPSTYVGIYADSYHMSGSAGGYLSAPKINRYATITKHQINSTSEHTIKVDWNADVSCNGLQCSLNGGNWFDVSGYPTYTLNNLVPGKQYSIKTRVKRQDSGLWTESGVIYGTTKDCVIRNKINGTWKSCVPYIKINGTWKKAIPYIKVNGTWKEGIN